ncbi:MAG: hypothetical protein ABJN35_08740 [Erythrobacter sp.]
MFSDKIKARLMGVALVGAVMTVPAMASAGVVVKSSGPSSSDYPVGRQVEDSSSITLRAGDKITVLTDGGTRVLQGPGTFRVGQGATRTRSQFSNLTRRRNSSRARTGAVRGGATSTGNPNLWYVNIAAAGPVCLYDLETVRLWRPATEGPQTYQITDQTTQTTLDVNFVETEVLRALDPDGLSLSEGTTYTVTAPAGEDGEQATTELTFVQLTDEGLAPDALAQTLIENGCMTQLTQLADKLEASAQ